MNTNRIIWIERLLVAILITSSSFFSWARLRNGHHWGDDFASYIMQAESILEHNEQEFIEENRLTIEQSTAQIGPLAYPWGVPLMLAPLVAWFGSNLMALKSLNLICYPLFLIVLWLGFQNKLSSFNKIFFVALFALNPEMVGFNTHIGSDIPFLLFSSACFFLIDRIIIEQKRFYLQVIDLIILGALIAFSFFIRTQGILLLFTLMFGQIITPCLTARETRLRQQAHTNHRLRVILIQLTPYITFVSLVAVWYHIFPDGSTAVLKRFDILTVQRILDNLPYYFNLPSEFFQKLPLANLIYYTSLPLLAIGLINRIKHDYHMLFYALLIFATSVVYPWQQGLRYLFPALSFYVYFVISGLRVCVDFANSMQFSTAKSLSQIGAILLILGFASLCAYDATRNLLRHRLTESGPYTAPAQDMFSYISEHTESQAIIVFFKPRALRMLTSRPSIQIEFPSHIDRGDYLCIYLGPDAYQQISAQQADELEKDGQLSLVYKNSEYLLYKIIKPPSSAIENFPSTRRSYGRYYYFTISGNDKVYTAWYP